MHNATMKSPRLQAVFSALLQEPLTTRQLIQRTGYCAINSIISELRACGIAVECQQLGQGLFLYTLEPEGE